MEPRPGFRSGTFGFDLLDQTGDDCVSRLEGGFSLLCHRPGCVRRHHFGLLDIGAVRSPQLPGRRPEQCDTNADNQAKRPSPQHLTA